MVSLLRQSAKAGELDRVSRPGDVDHVLDQLMNTDWVVYSKSCLSHTDGVVSYLARYSHRLAISDWRILSIEEDQVRFRTKDYADDDRHKVLPLSAEEFIRRFMLHVLPKGLMRIRHYGFLANRCRKEKLAKIRQLLGQAPGEEAADESAQAKTNDWACPKCHRGQMRVRLALLPICLAGG